MIIAVLYWLPRTIEQSVFRAIIRYEAIRRGKINAGIGSDLGDVVVEIIAEGKEAKAAKI